MVAACCCVAAQLKFVVIGHFIVRSSVTACSASLFMIYSFRASGCPRIPL